MLLTNQTKGQTMDYPSNSDDMIDSRDVIEALADLAQLHEAGPVELDGTLDGVDASDCAQDELFALERSLLALAAEASDYSEDWQYGATLIRYSYFKDYAIDLADDIGAIGKGLDWPLNCIDWEQAALELQSDYTSVSFDGVTYWVR